MAAKEPMEPNLALANIRLTARIVAETPDNSPITKLVAESALALDEWLSHGGVFPVAWHSSAH